MPPNPTYVDVGDLHKLQWITITHVGEENMYFTRMDTGENCYSKVAGYAPTA